MKAKHSFSSELAQSSSSFLSSEYDYDPITELNRYTTVDTQDFVTQTYDKVDTDSDKEQMVIKLALLGDPEVGKASFMRRYVNDTFQPSSYGYYGNSPGSVSFLEKQISLAQINLYIGLWCSSTHIIYDSALHLVCNEANVIIFMFSLTNKSSLNSIKMWYQKAQSVNKDFIPILVGTKYDIAQQNIATTNPLSHQYLEDYNSITKLARKYAMKLKASLIYLSSKDNININHTIKCCVAKVFNIKPKLKEFHWNTLQALREHNVPKLLRTWSNSKKMNALVVGYCKSQQFFLGSDTESNEYIVNCLVDYVKYDVAPYSSTKQQTNTNHANRKRADSKARKTKKKKKRSIKRIKKKKIQSMKRDTSKKVTAKNKTKIFKSDALYNQKMRYATQQIEGSHDVLQSAVVY